MSETSALYKSISKKKIGKCLKRQPSKVSCVVILHTVFSSNLTFETFSKKKNRSTLQRLMLHVKIKIKIKINKIISILTSWDSETSWLLRTSIWCACHGVFEKFSNISLRLHVLCQMTYHADFSEKSIKYKYYEVFKKFSKVSLLLKFVCKITKELTFENCDLMRALWGIRWCLRLQWSRVELW